MTSTALLGEGGGCTGATIGIYFSTSAHNQQDEGCLVAPVFWAFPSEKQCSGCCLHPAMSKLVTVVRSYTLPPGTYSPAQVDSIWLSVY